MILRRFLSLVLLTALACGGILRAEPSKDKEPPRSAQAVSKEFVSGPTLFQDGESPAKEGGKKGGMKGAQRKKPAQAAQSQASAGSPQRSVPAPSK